MEQQNNNELTRYVKALTRSMRWDQLIIRGCLTGTFIALGTTIGFALLIFASAQFITTFKQVPLLDVVLRETKLDVLIENQLNRINSSTSEANESESESEPETLPEAEKTESYLEYSNPTWAISFTYPATLTTVIDTTQGSNIQIIGTEGALLSLELGSNLHQVVGERTQFFVSRQGVDRLTVHIYEQGGQIDGNVYENPIFLCELRIPSLNEPLQFIAIGDIARPKLAREQFAAIMGSLQVNGD